MAGMFGQGRNRDFRVVSRSISNEPTMMSHMNRTRFTLRIDLICRETHDLCRSSFTSHLHARDFPELRSTAITIGNASHTFFNSLECVDRDLHAIGLSLLQITQNLREVFAQNLSILIDDLTNHERLHNFTFSANRIVSNRHRQRCHVHETLTDRCG
ncbi:hypothetical protein D3C87_1559870 [compost metagenome]